MPDTALRPTNKSNAFLRCKAPFSSNPLRILYLKRRDIYLNSSAHALSFDIQILVELNNAYRRGRLNRVGTTTCRVSLARRKQLKCAKRMSSHLDSDCLIITRPPSAIQKRGNLAKSAEIFKNRHRIRNQWPK